MLAHLENAFADGSGIGQIARVALRSRAARRPRVTPSLMPDSQLVNASVSLIVYTHQL